MRCVSRKVSSASPAVRPQPKRRCTIARGQEHRGQGGSVRTLRPFLSESPDQPGFQNLGGGVHALGFSTGTGYTSVSPERCSSGQPQAISCIYRLRFALCDNSILFRLQNCPSRCMLKKIVPCIQGTLLAPSAPGETPRSRDLPLKLTMNYPARMGHKSRSSPQSLQFVQKDARTDSDPECAWLRRHRNRRAQDTGNKGLACYCEVLSEKPTSALDFSRD